MCWRCFAILLLALLAAGCGRVTDSEQLGGLIRSHRPGDEVSVGIVHADGSQDEVTVTLGVNPVPTA